MARNCEAKFIETSAGIEHNVDELLVGILKQIRLRIEQDKMSISFKKTDENCTESSTENKKRDTNRRLSSPLRTLQVARDIITRTCLKSSKNRPVDCENLHIL